MKALLHGGMPHIPSVVGFAAFWGICYVMSVSNLTRLQLFLAIGTLIVVYCATAYWYIRTNES